MIVKERVQLSVRRHVAAGRTSAWNRRYPFRRIEPMTFRGILIALWLIGAGAGVLPGTSAAQDRRTSELSIQFHRAETAWKSGASMLEAKARVDRVLDALPDDVDALKLRAQVLLAMDRPEEALADARRAVRLRPDDGEAHLILCEVARGRGDEALARRALDAAAALVLDDAALHVRLSWNAMLLGDLEKAESFARIARAADPEEAAAYYQLARVFILKEEPLSAATILSNGLNDNVLDPGAIRADSVLARITDHSMLRSLLNR